MYEAIKLTYFVTDTNEETTLFYSTRCLSGITFMEIDGQPLDQPVQKYQFDTTGRHVVYVILNDNQYMSPLKFTNVTALREVVIPSTVTRLEPARTSNGLFYECPCIEKITCLCDTPPQYDYDGHGGTPYTAQADADFYGIALNGTLYVPKGCMLNYAIDTKSNQHGWWGGFDSSIKDGHNLRTYGWTLKELDERISSFNQSFDESFQQ